LESSALLRTLSDLREGTQSTVRKLRGGRWFASRMATLGFTIGASVTVVQNYRHGPMIVQVRDTRVALGRREARKVVVEVS
jgi:ferrous iron transport protein A